MIAEKLKYYRAINGLTQRDVAASAGIKPACIGQIESRNTDVYLSTVVKIASALEVKIEQLITPMTDIERARMKAANQRLYQAKIEKISRARKAQKQRHNERVRNGFS